MQNNKNGNKNKKNNAGVLFCIVLLILIAALCIITVVARVLEDRMNAPYSESSSSSDAFVRIEVDGIEYVKNPMVETILFLGIDTLDELEELTGYKHVLQADFIGLMVIDKNTETYSILQINRDTMMEMSILSAFGERIYDGAGEAYTIYQQITLSYNYGDGYTLSAENTAYNVSLLLNNISVDHYVAFGMSAIPILNDLVGGVEVTIVDDLTSIDETLIQNETITLNGSQALNYVQARMTVADGTNLNRAARQQEFLTKMYEKLISYDSNSFFVTATDAISGYMFTDTTANTLSNILKEIEDYEYLGFVEIEGTANYENELVEYYVDEESRISIVLDLFYEEVE